MQFKREKEWSVCVCVYRCKDESRPRSTGERATERERERKKWAVKSDEIDRRP